MNEDINIQEYLANGVKYIIKDALRASIKNPQEIIFLHKFSRHTRKATKIRQKYEEKGQNIPVFIIASITSSCNLHCTGCYSRANKACNDNIPTEQLTEKQWENIFSQARQIGISFIVLAGGEPLIRKDVITKATKYPEILFPIFTNGTIINREYLEIFQENKNLVPIISIEGDEQTTDKRRGKGIYKQVTESMEEMKEKHIIYGASITFTKNSLQKILSEKYIEKLHEMGCKVVFFIEYVPINEQTRKLAPNDEDREELLENLNILRRKYDDMLFLSFPGDEKTSGGCLAAGRGFFHINSHGDAEPCPASPYSDINVRDNTLLDALNSKLFKSLRDEGILIDHHEGGCVLFEHQKEVERLLEN